MADFDGSGVLVTGAARGIGLTVALAFLRAGARVTLADMDGAALAATVQRLATLGPVLSLVADVAEAVLYLASPRAGFITGQMVVVDGGMTRRMFSVADEGS